MAFTEIQDDNGAIAAEYVSKYLRGAEMGNFVSMAPGLIDVRFHPNEMTQLFSG